MTDLFSWTRSHASHDLDREQAPRATLSMEQVVDQIISINRSASVEYLSQFKRESLDKYLDHLLCTQKPRGRGSNWDRPGDAPAIMVRRRIA
jgi:hypothetical protein